MSTLSWIRENGWLGEELLQQEKRKVVSLAQDSFRFVSTAGTRVCVVPSTNTSDVAEYVQNVDLVVGFGYSYRLCGFSATERVQIMRISLRTRADYDCAGFAKLLGGGGHKSAAGATIHHADKDPLSQIMELLDQYETMKGKS